MHRSLIALALPIGAMLIATACTGGAPTPDGRVSGGPQVLVASADPSATEVAPTPLTTPAPSSEPTFALPSPTRAPDPLPSGLAPDIVAAIAWRRETGLRSDPGWVLRVSEDPTASGSWAYPILPGEEAFIWARQERLQPVVGLVQRHAGEYPDEYGGLYIDNANSRVATLWTTNLALHLAAIRELAGADAPVVVLPARWSEAELRAVQDRFDWRWPGFAAVDADPQGAGVDTVRNVVTIDISSANPDALRLIAERLAADLGVPVEMLEVTSDGTGVALLPYGTVKGVVVLAGGAKPGANSLTVDGRAETIGSCGGGDMGYGVGEDGRFEIPCRVGTYTLEITGPGPGGDGGVVVGRARVVVRADRVSVVRIRLVPGAVVGG